MSSIKFSGKYDDLIMDLNAEPTEPKQQPETPAPTPQIPEKPDDPVQRFLRVTQSIDVRTDAQRHLSTVESESKPGWMQQKMQHKPKPSAAEPLAQMAPTDDDFFFVDPLALLLKPAKAEQEHEHEDEYDSDED